jgi:hypothetical protein
MIAHNIGGGDRTKGQTVLHCNLHTGRLCAGTYRINCSQLHPKCAHSQSTSREIVENKKEHKEPVFWERPLDLCGFIM